MKSRIVVFAVMSMLSAMALGGIKIGVADMAVLMRNHRDYERNEKLLESTDKDYKRTLEEIEAEGEKLQDEGKRYAEQLRNPMLNEKSKADAEKSLAQLQEKLTEIGQRYRTKALSCQRELADLRTRLLKTVADELKKTIDEYAEDNDYDLIIDSAAALHLNSSIDVTDELLKKLGVDPEEAKGKTDESK